MKSSSSRTGQLGGTSKLSTTKLIEQYCVEHEGEIYTNFCSSMTCVKPLCPQCIENHYIHHKNLKTQPQIDSFKTLRNKCFNKITTILENVNCNHNHQMLPLEINQIQQQSINKIHQSCDHCHKIIDSYFNNLEYYIKRQIQKIMSQQSDFIFELQKNNNIISELQMLEKKLENNSTFLLSASTIIKLDGDKIQNKIKQNYKFINKFKQNQKNNLYIEKGYQDKLINYLSKLIYYGNYDNLQSMPKIGQELIMIKLKQQKNKNKQIYHNSNNNNIFNNFYQENKTISNYQNKNINNYQSNNNNHNDHHNDHFKQDDKRSRKSSHKSNMKIQKKTIFSMNTFKEVNSRKFLHFFQNDQNILHYLELESQQSNFEQIQMNINFNIADFHKSITTPKGDLYLIGGSQQNQIYKSQKIYKYDFNSNKLIHQNSMINGRSSHSLCFNNKFIYIMGGFINNQIITNKCQRYDITTKSIQEISSMKHQACSFACASFNGRFIYKFGGIGQNHHVTHFIEIYDEKQNYWQEVNPAVQLLKGQYLLPLSTSAAIQITQTQIFIMGGYDKDSIGHKQTYIFKVENNGNTIIKDINTYPLPIGQGFWNNTPIIYQRMVFALQNVAYGPDQCSQNSRKILVFDGQGWKSLN